MILIGGAPRTGKGIIANMLMQKMHLPFLSIDPIKMALANAVPTYPLNTNDSSIAVSMQMWPFVSALIDNMYQTNVEYIIEGEILPKHAQIISKTCQCVTCFIGYSQISVEEKCAQIRKYSGYPNDWTNTLSDAALVDVVKNGIEYSQYVQNECKKYAIQYIDFSDDFEKSLANTVDYIIDNNEIPA